MIEKKINQPSFFFNFNIFLIFYRSRSRSPFFLIANQNNNVWNFRSHQSDTPNDEL